MYIVPEKSKLFGPDLLVCLRQLTTCFHTPGICPNMSAKPPRVSLSSFTLWGMKGLSRKKSFLIP